EVFDLTLTLFCIERLLYRLSRSPYREQFVLKGAALFVIWGGAPHRATRDVDLLGRHPAGLDSVERAFRELCLLPVEPDGLVFPSESLGARRIHEGQEHEGVRVTLTARLGQARIPLQVDVGFGSAVVPSPVEEVYPTLLPFPAPRLLAYPREVSVSEKFHAMVVLGMASSRLKDYYDVWVMASRFAFDGSVLRRSLGATFERRNTPLPREVPLALTEAFAHDREKRTQWEAFLRRGQLEAGTISLETAVAAVREFVMPPTLAAAEDGPFEMEWRDGGPWTGREQSTAHPSSP
ncbi:MAG: nucleotidyl transferase AbiEii/AbiGii toxin family protein, partial [Chloroflexota bacterium]|nr:nucleotidyl transferase AbiEii/AbiGii toxin family protein [Chloroflexota bacterium]